MCPCIPELCSVLLRIKFRQLSEMEINLPKLISLHEGV
jgi:hypothetical protein